MRKVSKAVWSGIATAAAVLAFSAPVAAQVTATQNVTATANVAARARLTVTGTVSFADADPTTNPTVSAAALDIDVQARTSPAGSVTLTVQAGGDFTSGTDTIAINNLSWTATGTGFVGGTMATTAQNVGSWTGPAARNGTQTYTLVNSWNYAPGTYTTTLTYTLTAP